MTNTQTDVLIIGAGAAGLMCAIAAGKRGRSVTILEHTDNIGEKIRISGGGRCNFTNIHTAPSKFISNNPHFCTSALKRYTPRDFISMVERHGIPYHEKALGQLFCDNSANDIIDMLLTECSEVGVKIRRETPVTTITKTDAGFAVQIPGDEITASSLVIATGGLSIPKIGATPFGYQIAKQFGLNVIEPRAGLAPLTFTDDILELTHDLTGVSIDPVVVTAANKTQFREALLFTHRGLSGPVILQISSYWLPGEAITINLSPDVPVLPWLKEQRQKNAKLQMQNILALLLPKRLAQYMADMTDFDGERIADINDAGLKVIAQAIEQWDVTPNGTEGYRTAEVTLGGVDTNDLSSKTFEAKTTPGLYFIGEVIDVTGHLGGYNFQWAWASGHCAGQFV